ncbi:carbon-nitrogen hydrolase family protein [Patescibacteria group bacterium]|nr:carbon-nitrogen hydrolase family protein [Patescibacteria group bacterium]
MKVRIAQVSVSKDIHTNLDKVISILQNSSSNEWVLFPEGMISGYYPEEETFLSQLNSNAIEQALDKVDKITKEKNINCLVGSALKLDNNWYNCTIFINPNQKIIYRKNNLSIPDRNHFSAGNELKTYKEENVSFGIQMCRELIFPEQWKILKKNGAQVIFHVNNAIKESDKIWEQILVARAFENQFWVCSVNNAASPQTMCSMIIDPYGKIVWQSTPQKEEVHTENIDLSSTSNHYLQQERTDLVKIVRS